MGLRLEGSVSSRGGNTFSKSNDRVCVLWESAVTGCVCQGVFKLQRLKSVNQLCSRCMWVLLPWARAHLLPPGLVAGAVALGVGGYPPLCGASSWPFPVLSGSLLSHDTHFLKEAAVCGHLRRHAVLAVAGPHVLS